MGFEILSGDADTDGIAVTTNYDERGGTRVLFRRRLDEALDQKKDLELRKQSATERDAELGC